ncbi:hypothetical protein J6590_099085, partial [Homalodisca vitripennis]
MIPLIRVRVGVRRLSSTYPPSAGVSHPSELTVSHVSRKLGLPPHRAASRSARSRAERGRPRGT